RFQSGGDARLEATSYSLAQADSVLPWDGPDSSVRLRVPVPDCPAALRVHLNFNKITPSLPPTCPNSVSDPTPTRAIAQSGTGLPRPVPQTHFHVLPNEPILPPNPNYTNLLTHRSSEPAPRMRGACRRA